MVIDLATLWLIVWLLKNAAIDISSAVKGTPNPRYELKKARARAAGRPLPEQPRYGTREWLDDLVADGLRAQTEWRRQRSADRRAKRDQERTDTETEGTATPDPESRDPQPAPEPPSPPTPQPSEQDKQGEDDTPEPPQPQASEPTARVIPFPTKPKENPVSTAVNGEIVGLDQSIAYAKALGTFAGEHGPAGNEGYIGHLTKAKVRGAGLQTAHDMQEAFELAQAAAEKHTQELERQKGVQEQYDLNPDAGDKDFQQQGR